MMCLPVIRFGFVRLHREGGNAALETLRACREELLYNKSRYDESGVLFRSSLRSCVMYLVSVLKF